MKVCVLTLLVVLSLSGADPRMLALALKAQSDFERVELTPRPGIPDTDAPGRYLLLAPGQDPPADVTGYAVRHSPTFNIELGVRLTDTDPEKQKQVLSDLRVYPYAQRANPPQMIK